MRRLSTFLLVTCALATRVMALPDLPDGFALQDVVLEPFIGSPVGFAFLPDGRPLVIEKDTGVVRLAPTNSTASVVIATIPGVTNQAERGLLGVAVDPDWPQRPYVYFHSTRTGSVIHITMYTAAGDLTDPTSTNVTLGSPYVLLDDIPDTRVTHNGGTLRFGPDGFLYVSLGEDVQGCEAQNLATPLGKILRLDITAMPGPGGGPPAKSAITPAGNPFTGGDWQGLVYAYGLRNPFRFTIDPASGDLYIGDVGLNTWEEIDVLVQSGYTGDNYGWPEFEGPLQDPDPIFADCSTPPFVDPIHVYPNPPGAPVVAILSGPLYRTDAHAPLGFPRAYEGDLFLADFYGGWIRRLHRNGVTWTVADSVAGQPSAGRWAQDLSQISDLQQGPDGALYFMSYVNGGAPRGVHRIVNTLPSDTEGWVGSNPLRVRTLPNPARVQSGITLQYWLARPERAEVRIYDPAGRLKRVFHPSPGIAGTIYWDGRARDGSPVRSGTYFYELETRSGGFGRGKITIVP